MCARAVCVSANHLLLFDSTDAQEGDESRGDAALPPCTPPASWLAVSAPSETAPLVSLALLASLSSRSPPSLEQEEDMTKEEEARKEEKNQKPND